MIIKPEIFALYKIGNIHFALTQNNYTIDLTFNNKYAEFAKGLI